MYNAINFSLPMMELGFLGPIYGGNTTIGLTTIQTLLCPSESVSKTPSYAVTQFAMLNYAGNFGGPGMIKSCNGTVVPVQGSFMYGIMALLGATPPASSGPVRVSSITDGMSNTALFSEHLLAYGDGVFATTDPSVTPGGPNGKRGIFQTAVPVVLDQGNVTGALAAGRRVQGLTRGDDRRDRRRLRSPVALER